MGGMAHPEVGWFRFGFMRKLHFSIQWGYDQTFSVLRRFETD